MANAESVFVYIIRTPLEVSIRETSQLLPVLQVGCTKDRENLVIRLDNHGRGWGKLTGIDLVVPRTFNAESADDTRQLTLDSLRPCYIARSYPCVLGLFQLTLRRNEVLEDTECAIRELMGVKLRRRMLQNLLEHFPGQESKSINKDLSGTELRLCSEDEVSHVQAFFMSAWRRDTPVTSKIEFFHHMARLVRFRVPSVEVEACVRPYRNRRTRRYHRHGARDAFSEREVVCLEETCVLPVGQPNVQAYMQCVRILSWRHDFFVRLEDSAVIDLREELENLFVSYPTAPQL